MQIASQPRKWPSILLAVLNLTGLAFFLSSAGLLVVSGLVNSILPTADQGTDPASGFLLAFALGLCCAVFIPAVIFSLRRVFGKQIRQLHLQQARLWQLIAIGTAWVGCCLLVDFLYQNLQLGWLAAVPFFLAAIALPVLALVWIAAGGLPYGSFNRFWSSLALSMSISPLVSALLEFGLGLVAVLLGLVALILRPDWLSAVEQLANQLSTMKDIDQAARLLAPYLVNPFGVTCLFLVMSVCIPLIEEAVKPLAVWISGRALRSPAEGFAAGALCGAGFALVEGLIAASNPSEGWALLLAARAGGSLMHITASGLMGWAIVSAWHGKPARLAWTYLLCVGLHGLWNGAAVLGILATLQVALDPSGSASLINRLSLASAGIITLIVPASLIVLLLVNHRLRPVKPELSDIIAPPASQT